MDYDEPFAGPYFIENEYDSRFLPWTDRNIGVTLAWKSQIWEKVEEHMLSFNDVENCPPDYKNGRTAII